LESRRLTRDIVELVIRAPLAAKQYKPAQVFRLQNYEASSTLVEGTRLQTETIPLTGSRIDKSAGTISVIVRERGASSRLCATLKPGDEVVLMGPGGNVTAIPSGQTVMVIGDWLAIAALRALGPAYRGGGNRVLAVLNVPTAEDVFCKDELERCCDGIVWVTDEGDPVNGIRPQDVAATGELTEVLARYGAGELTNGQPAIPLEQVNDLHITADSALLKRIQRARKNELAPFLTNQPKATASVYSSMQCMLKGVCSQCLQWQVDPKTGERTKAVFACSWHDEPADMVDIDELNERLGQNRLQERLSNLWLSYLFDRHPVERV
jgi:NAD(P)H-flavin reductase